MIKKDIKKILSEILKLKEIKNTKDLPLLASLAMAVPILIGLLSNNLKLGITASLAAIIVVYFPLEGSFSERILMLIGCSFGFISVYTIGLIFSFNRIISVIVFGITVGIIHWTVSHFKLKPPKDFFFIMLCSTAISIPHQAISKIAENIGYLTFGTLSTCLIVFLYCLIVGKKSSLNKTMNIPHIPLEIKKNVIESVIFAVFLSIALGAGYYLNLANPYWVAVACIAVMQGSSAQHIFLRSIQRVIGTLIGVIFCWGILLLVNNPWEICILIIIFQFIVEYLVPRNYGIAMIFITPMTIFLSEASTLFSKNHILFIQGRFFNTLVGSLIGIVGGYIVYHEKIREII